jgi:peptidoglycan/LPS O-acetylase OafA/YrhL
MIKNNNFDFLRFIFALLVVISHSYPLSGNNVSSQWIVKITNGQIELSSIGLSGFFILSGYLIFQSLERSASVFDYYWKRILRIFPALFVVLLITIILVPFVYESTIPFFKNKQVYTYLPNNISLYHLQYSIKGVFKNNPYPSAINGSLWTICYEFSLYVLLSLLFLVRKNLRLVRILLSIVFIIMFTCYNFFMNSVGQVLLFGMEGIHFLNLGTFFVCGSLLASFKFEKINNKKHIFFGIVFLIIVSIYFDFHNLIKHVTLTALILLIGLKPLRFISNFYKIGDMSYGIYIYGFPIQQLLMYFFKLNVLLLMISSVILSIGFGYLSWHLVEKRSLKYKKLAIFQTKTNLFNT